MSRYKDYGTSRISNLVAHNIILYRIHYFILVSTIVHPADDGFENTAKVAISLCDMDLTSIRISMEAGGIAKTRLLEGRYFLTAFNRKICPMKPYFLA